MTITDAPAMPTHNLGGDYPTDWQSYIGQERAKRQLITEARSARLQHVPMRHVLISSGTPGIGKTALSLLAAKECGAAQIKVAGGKISAGEARLLLAGMDDGDVLFIDEIHTLVAGGSKADWLLNFLQDGVIMRGRGAEEQPKVTVIAATTDKGRLPDTYLDRFVPVELDPYTLEEAAQIARTKAERTFPKPMPVPTLDTCRAIARAASNSPRVIGQILGHVKNIMLVNDGASVENGGNWTGTDYDLTLALDWMGLTEDGLTRTCVRYLTVLLEDFAGAPAGKAAMEDFLREPGGLHQTERLLMEKGLVTKGRTGRELSQAGIRRAKELLR